MPPAESHDLEDLLADLTYWERNYGTRHGPAADLASTGEAPSRIASLKERLKEAGAVYHWDGERYVLEEIVSPGEGREVDET